MSYIHYDIKSLLFLRILCVVDKVKHDFDFILKFQRQIKNTKVHEIFFFLYNLLNRLEEQLGKKKI